jgi:hypothetical protein
MNASDVIEKIDILWFENVEFSRTAPLSWAEFFAGFSEAEKAIYNAAFPA